jgi:tetratricopeptide (TPR) repeat protein
LADDIRLNDELLATAESDEDRAIILLSKAASFANEEQYEEAEALVIEAIDLDSLTGLNKLNSQLVLAEYKARNGSFEEAILILEEILSGPSSDDIEALEPEISKRIESYKSGEVPDFEERTCEVESGEFEPC